MRILGGVGNVYGFPHHQLRVFAPRDEVDHPDRVHRKVFGDDLVLSDHISM